MAFRIEIGRPALEKALEIAQASAVRASNQKGVNPLIKEIHLKDAETYRAAMITITEVK